MTVEEAQEIVPARVDSVWDPKSQSYKKVYCPTENNPYGAWWNEAQYLNIARAKKRRQDNARP